MTIELKTRKLLPAAVGQLNMFLTYHKDEANDPIGLILCNDKPSAENEYVLGGLENRISASNCVLYLPGKKHWRIRCRHSSRIGKIENSVLIFVFV